MTEENLDKTAIFDNESLELNVNIYTIEKAKNQFLLNLNTFSKNEIVENLKNLLSLIESFLYKYLDEEEIKKIKIKDYDFFEIKNSIELLDDLDLENTREASREIATISYAIFNKVLYKLKVAIPLIKRDFKKKIISDFFDIVNFKNYGFNSFEEFQNSLLNEYSEKIKKLGLKDTRLNFLAFCYDKLHVYDLDGFTVISGFPRVGKSTLALDLTRRIFAFRLEKTLKEATKFARDNWLKNYVFYIPSHYEFSRRFERENDQIFLLDEGYFAGDRREAMNFQQIKTTQTINAFANHRHITFFIIQFSEDLDFRFFKRAIAWVHCYERGKALIFTRQKSFSFQNDIFGVEKIFKSNIRNKDVYLYLLRRRALGKITWHKLASHEKSINFEKEINRLKLGYDLKPKTYYDTYLILKNYYQGLYTEKKEKEKMDEMKEFEIIENIKARIKGNMTIEDITNELVAKGINEKIAKKLVKKAKEKLELENLAI